MKNMILLAATALICSSCFHVNSNWTGGRDAIKGEGEVITKSFDLKDFDQIVLNGHADVTFIQSETFDVTVRSQANVFEHLDYRVEGTKLILENKKKVTIRAQEFDVTVKAPTLQSITVNGAGDLNIEGGLTSDEDFKVLVNGAGDLSFETIRCKDLSIEVNGAADIDLTSIAVNDLKIVVNGAGDVTATGKAENATLRVNGAGDIDARGLSVAGKVTKSASGLAKIQL